MRVKRVNRFGAAVAALGQRYPSDAAHV